MQTLAAIVTLPPHRRSKKKNPCSYSAPLPFLVCSIFCFWATNCREDNLLPLHTSTHMPGSMGTVTSFRYVTMVFEIVLMQLKHMCSLRCLIVADRGEHHLPLLEPIRLKVLTCCEHSGALSPHKLVIRVTGAPTSLASSGAKQTETPIDPSQPVCLHQQSRHGQTQWDVSTLWCLLWPLTEAPDL